MRLGRMMMAAALIVAVAVGAPFAARPAGAAGTTLSWVGSGNWSVAANWSPAQVPADGDSLVFPLDDPTVGPADNDMTGLTLDSISWATDAKSGGCNGATSLSGNAFTVTGDITAAKWCYDSPPVPFENAVVLAAGSHTIDGVEMDGTLSGSGAVLIDGPVWYANSQSNTYTGGTAVAGTQSQVGTLILKPSLGAIAIPAQPEPISVTDGEMYLDTDGAIAPSDSLDICQDCSFETDLETATVPIRSITSDGVIYLSGQLDVGNLELGPDGDLFPFGLGGVQGAPNSPQAEVGITASGQVDLGGTLSFDNDLDADNPPALILIDDTSGHAPTGTFAGLPQGASVSTGFGQTPASYKITYNAAGGDDVALTSSENSLSVSFSNSQGASATVTSNPSGIDCPGTCTAVFPPNTPITLTATAATGDVISSTQAYSDSVDGCTPAAPTGTYATETCILDVYGGTVANFGTEPINASLDMDGAVHDSGNQQLDLVWLDACQSTGAATYAFTVDGTSEGGPQANCDISVPLNLGNHSATVQAASTDGKVTSSETVDFTTSSVAAFTWKVAPVPYGSSVDSTNVTFDACSSAGVALYQWDIPGSGVPEKDVTNCDYTVSLPTNQIFDVTLTVIGPNGSLTSTSAQVPVYEVYEEPNGCSVFSISSNSCFREGLDWFGDFSGVSGNPMRPPDYLIAEVSGGEFGTGGGNVAVTCDGNVYVGVGGGFSLGLLPVSSVLAYGYVGDPTTVAPTEAQIDSFVSGETDSMALSDFGAQFAVIHSPQADGPQIGEEYGGGLVAPGVSLTSSYDWALPGDITPPDSAQCTDGVTGSPEWQLITNISNGTAGGAPSFNPLSGSAPTAGQGVEVYLTVPPGTFAPGASVQVGSHSPSLVDVATVAADKTGRIGALIKLPASLAVGPHTLILSGESAANPLQAKTVTMKFDISAATVPVTVALGSQTITFTSTAPADATVGGIYTPTATGGVSGNPVVFTIATGSASACTISSGVVHFSGAGSCVIDANQAANTNYSAASQVTQTVTVHVSSVAAGDRVAVTPGGAGYWVVGPNGIPSAFGDAVFYGSMGGKPLDAPVVGIAATPSGHGYWLVASDGGVFSFGDAAFYGSMGGKSLTAPVVGMAATPGGHGYWLVASDGGVFAFGDAVFYGSMGGKPLDAPVVGIAATPGGHGYWLVASDGGVFSFGDAAFYGSMGGKPLDAPVVGIAATPDGHGYWLVASDGGVFSFGDAVFYGSMGGKPLNAPVVGLFTAAGGTGYNLVNADGAPTAFGG